MANSKIPNLNLSDTLNTQRLKFNQLLDSVGDVSTLTTTAGPVTDAINELDAELGTITSGAMGTTASTVSGAIAELDGRLDSINNTQLTSPEIRITGSSVSSVAGKLEVGDSADFASNVSVQGNLAVGGNTTMSGTLTVDGQVTFKAGSDNNISLGDAATDTITLTGEVNSNVVPDADDTYDLGSASKEWRHVYVDGTVNADNVAADSATIGTLTVTGDTTFNNTITVQDSAYITGDLDVGANLTVATQATLASAAVSDLTSGRVVIAGTSGELQDDGKLTWNTTTGLKTTEALTVEDSAYVTGNLNVGGNLGVTGNITLGGDITIGDANTDNVAFNADINSSIIPNTDNTYDLGSASQEWRHVYVDGTVNADNVAADSATIGTLTVTGDTTLNNTITVQDSAYITGNLDIGGQATIASAAVSDLSNGRVVIAGAGGELQDDSKLTWNTTTGLKTTEALTVADSAYITGDLVLGSNLKTPSSFTLGAAATSISIGSYNTGTTTIQHDLVVDSNLTVHGIADLDSTSITGNLIMNTDKFTVDHLGNTVIAGTLDVQGVTTLDSASVVGTFDVNGVSEFDSANFVGAVDITGSLNVSNGFTVGGTFTTTGTTRNAASYVIVNDQVPVSNSNRAGLAIDRPSNDSAVMQWNEEFDYWEAGTTTNLRQLARQDDSAAFTNVYVGGNLTVNGTTTTVNSTTVEIGDNIILLNDSLAGSGIANTVDAGIEIERGTLANTSLLWDEGTDRWVVSGAVTGTLAYTSEIKDATITLTAGTDLSTGGNFTTNQSANETITIDHSDITRTDVSTSESPGSGGSFDVVDSIQSNARGHITQVATRTITLPTSDNYGSWTLQGDGGSNQTISSGNTVDIAGGTYITTTTSATDTLTVAHDDTTRTDVSTSESPGYGGSFEVIDSIQSNATGHITQVATRTITLPASDNTNQLTVWYIEDSDGTEKTMNHNKELKILGDNNHITTNFGSGTGTDGSPYDLKISHALSSAAGATIGGSVTSGGSFSAVTGVTFDEAGHVDSVQTTNFSVFSNTNTDTLQSIATNSTNVDQYITFVPNTTGAQTGRVDAGLLYNPSSNQLKLASGSVKTSVISSYSASNMTFKADGYDFIFQSETENTVSRPVDIILKNTNTSPTDDEEIGRLRFRAENTASQDTDYAQIVATTADVSDITEDGEIAINVLSGGSTLTAFEAIGDGNTTIKANADITLDAPGDITLDADGNNIYLKNGGGGDTWTYTLNDNASGSFATPGAWELQSGGLLTLSSGATGGNTAYFDAANIHFRPSGASDNGLFIGKSTDLGGYQATTIGPAITPLSADDDLNIKSNRSIFINTRNVGYPAAHDITIDADSDINLIAGGGIEFKSDTNIFTFQAATSSNTSRPPDVIIHNNDTIPADAQLLGNLEFSGENSASSDKSYVRISGYQTDISSGTEDGEIDIKVMNNGLLTTVFEAIGSSNTTIQSPSDIYLKPTGDDVYMQGTTSNEQIRFTLGTTSQSIIASDAMNVGATGGDLTLYTTTSGDLDLNPASGRIGLWDNGSEQAGFDVNTSGELKVYTGSNFATLNSTFSGDDLTVQGDITSVSDVRTKENIETVENSLDLVSQLRGVWYNKIGKEDRKVGVIAQEVEEVLPEVVHTDIEGMKAVDYGKIVGVLIEAVKELKQEIEELKSR